MMVEQRGAPPSRLQRTGAHIMRSTGSLGGSPQSSQPGSQPGSRPPSAGALQRQRMAQTPFARQGGPGARTPDSDVAWNPAPPSAGRTGRLWAPESCPSLTPYNQLAANVPALQSVKLRKIHGPPEAVPKSVWSDSVQHLGCGEPWPAHAIPLFVFHGVDRPRPGYREEIRFNVSDEKYVNFCLKLRCGVGDRHGGGTVGLLQSDGAQEAFPGQPGQLVTVTGVTILPDSTVLVDAVGDLDFQVLQPWMPRGMRGLQLAHIDVAPSAPQNDLIMDTCAQEPSLSLFAELLHTRAPRIAEILSSKGPFTVFVPTSEALSQVFGPDPQAAPEEIEAYLAAHICPGKVTCEALYSGRTMQAIDGTSLHVTYARWPRGDPCVNDIPVEHLDIVCCNGVVHTLAGVLTPLPVAPRR
mmetsp:Transcript_36077/g.92995  ORF Transcript_36077/g.92995 Transcript_36077/m.92995 type:complete len:411 (+) Transcript_36077:2-1234(+)